MAKIIFDVIQRFEVEDGVPRLVSSTTNVIAGGEDLMSLATNLLERLGFDEKFKVSRASQYIGYRLKHPGKGAKRYQLVLAQRKEGLCISIPQDILGEHLLELGYWIDITEDPGVTLSTVGRIWVFPTKKDIFLNSLSPQYWDKIQTQEKTTGQISLNECINIDPYTYSFFSVIPNSDVIPRNEFCLEIISDTSSYLILNEDKLFPYTWQVSISSVELLEEFIIYFAKILMEQH